MAAPIPDDAPVTSTDVAEEICTGGPLTGPDLGKLPDAHVRCAGYGFPVIDELPIPAGLLRCIAAYAPLCDDGRFAEWGDLFCEDASFRVMGRSSEGRAAIRAFIERGQPPERRGKHLCSAPLVSMVSEREALAWTEYVFVTPDGPITSSGRYHDRLVRGDDGRWRFALREIVFTGQTPELAGQPDPG